MDDKHTASLLASIDADITHSASTSNKQIRVSPNIVRSATTTSQHHLTAAVHDQSRPSPSTGRTPKYLIASTIRHIPGSYPTTPSPVVPVAPPPPVTTISPQEPSTPNKPGKFDALRAVFREPSSAKLVDGWKTDTFFTACDHQPPNLTSTHSLNLVAIAVDEDFSGTSPEDQSVLEFIKLFPFRVLTYITGIDRSPAKANPTPQRALYKSKSGASRPQAKASYQDFATGATDIMGNTNNTKRDSRSVKFDMNTNTGQASGFMPNDFNMNMNGANNTGHDPRFAMGNMDINVYLTSIAAAQAGYFPAAMANSLSTGMQFQAPDGCMHPNPWIAATMSQQKPMATTMKQSQKMNQQQMANAAAMNQSQQMPHQQIPHGFVALNHPQFMQQQQKPNEANMSQSQQMPHKQMTQQQIAQQQMLYQQMLQQQMAQQQMAQQQMARQQMQYAAAMNQAQQMPQFQTTQQQMAQQQALYQHYLQQQMLQQQMAYAAAMNQNGTSGGAAAPQHSQQQRSSTDPTHNGGNSGSAPQRSQQQMQQKSSSGHRDNGGNSGSAPQRSQQEMQQRSATAHRDAGRNSNSAPPVPKRVQQLKSASGNRTNSSNSKGTPAQQRSQQKVPTNTKNSIINNQGNSEPPQGIPLHLHYAQQQAIGNPPQGIPLYQYYAKQTALGNPFVPVCFYGMTWDDDYWKSWSTPAGLEKLAWYREMDKFHKPNTEGRRRLSDEEMMEGWYATYDAKKATMVCPAGWKIALTGPTVGLEEWAKRASTPLETGSKSDSMTDSKVESKGTKAQVAAAKKAVEGMSSKTDSKIENTGTKAEIVAAKKAVEEKESKTSSKIVIKCTKAQAAAAKKSKTGSK